MLTDGLSGSPSLAHVGWETPLLILFYLPGSLYGAISPAHVISVIIALIMTGAVILGLYIRTARKVLGIAGWTSFLIYILYGIKSLLLFRYGHAPG